MSFHPVIKEMRNMAGNDLIARKRLLSSGH